MNSQEKIKVVKIKLKNILHFSKTNRNKVSNITNIIEDACIRVNKIITHTYQFLKLYFIIEKDSFLEINHDVILMTMKLFMTENKRGKPIDKNKDLLEKLTLFF